MTFQNTNELEFVLNIDKKLNTGNLNSSENQKLLLIRARAICKAGNLRCNNIAVCVCVY